MVEMPIRVMLALCLTLLLGASPAPAQSHPCGDSLLPLLEGLQPGQAQGCQEGAWTLAVKQDALGTRIWGGFTQDGPHVLFVACGDAPARWSLGLAGGKPGQRLGWRTALSAVTVQTDNRPARTDLWVPVPIGLTLLEPRPMAEIVESLARSSLTRVSVGSTRLVFQTRGAARMLALLDEACPAEPLNPADR